MDIKSKLEKYENKVVKNIVPIGDCELLITFKDGSELDISAVEELGCKLEIDCDIGSSENKLDEMNLFTDKSKEI